MNNYQLCNEISDRVVHHFVHCIETHGRHVQYLKFLETIVKADGKYVKKCQDKVMTEVKISPQRNFFFTKCSSGSDRFEFAAMVVFSW